jgi:Domain of unknown function (DUF4167)
MAAAEQGWPRSLAVRRKALQRRRPAPGTRYTRQFSNTDEMRSGPDQRSRGRFNQNRPFKQQARAPQPNQTFDSNGPDVRVRGTAHQIFERYIALAREAATSDDRIATENFYQHAEHYFRINNANRERNTPQAAAPATPGDATTFGPEIGSGEDR